VPQGQVPWPRLQTLGSYLFFLMTINFDITK
jgi:hypothetical protein